MTPDVARLLEILPRVDEDAQARLHARLVAAAEHDGVLDVAYRTIDSPVGELLLAATGQGLLRVAYACEGGESVLARLAREVSPRILRAPRRLDRAARQIDEYFAGRRAVFDVPLDLRLSRGFRRGVLAYLSRLPYGETVTYTEAAAAVGRPRAIRAVAGACATNPVPLVVPCHRVVRSDGSLAGYIGGLPAKRLLLDLEAAGIGTERPDTGSLPGRQ
jgi:methylated-DNA-[protein]-cysteine S-methyltransferase